MKLDTLMGYGLLGTIAISASTIASAVVGEPFPVVVPMLFAGFAVAAHHVWTKDTSYPEPDDQLDDDATDRDTNDGVDRATNDGVDRATTDSHTDPFAEEGST